MNGTVTIDRAEFDAIVVEIGAVWELISRLYGGDDLDAFIPGKLSAIQRRLLIASGVPVSTDGEWLDEEALDERFDRERARRNELLVEYAEKLFEEAQIGKAAANAR